MRQKINPRHLFFVFNADHLLSIAQTLTAAVPNIAPLAPTDGIPTRAKFPPSMLLAQKFTVRYRTSRNRFYVPEDTSCKVKDKESHRTHFSLDLSRDHHLR